jgi:hypothetical protein
MFCCCGSKPKTKDQNGPAIKTSVRPTENVSPSAENLSRKSLPIEKEESAPHKDMKMVQSDPHQPSLQASRFGQSDPIKDNDNVNPEQVFVALEVSQVQQQLSVNREASINKAPSFVEIESKAIMALGISTVERMAGQMVARYKQDVTLEEFMYNISSPGGYSPIKMPFPGKSEINNPLMKKGNTQRTIQLTESKLKDRRKKAIKDKLSTIKSIFCKEIISDIIYDNKEKEFCRAASIPSYLFMLRGKSIMKHLFSFLGTVDKVNLLLAIKHKVAANKDSNLLFLCLVKAALAFELPSLISITPWNDFQLFNLKEVVQSNLDQDPLLRYISLFINLPILQVDGTYSQLLAEAYPKINDIDKDITRTFPEFFCTTHRRNVLREVLVALSNSCPIIGYVQGINAITGAIMIYFENKRMTDGIENSPEVLKHLTFVIVKFMLERRALSLMYERSLYGFTLLCLEIKLWVKVLHPNLYEYLVQSVDQGR